MATLIACVWRCNAAFAFLMGDLILFSGFAVRLLRRFRRRGRSLLVVSLGCAVLGIAVDGVGVGERSTSISEGRMRGDDGGTGVVSLWYGASKPDAKNAEYLAMLTWTCTVKAVRKWGSISSHERDF
jgi:hypothetical protein